MGMRCKTCGRAVKAVAQCDICRLAEEIDSCEEWAEIERNCVLVWAPERRTIEALVAQWPGHHEVLTADEPGDWWGVRLALHPDGVGADPTEYKVQDGKLVRLDTAAILAAVLGGAVTP
jgi:hypothetical protein